MATHADGDDLIARYDVDVVGDLATDDRNSQDRIEVPTDPNVAVALESASGEVEGALISGGRYSIDDLTGLTGSSLALLKTIVCAVAMRDLLERRPGSYPELLEKIQAKVDRWLEQLTSGAALFGSLEDTHADAGTPTVDGPSTAKMDELNLLPSRMSRYFPNMEQRLPKRQQHG